MNPRRFVYYIFAILVAIWALVGRLFFIEIEDAIFYILVAIFFLLLGKYWDQKSDDV